MAGTATSEGAAGELCPARAAYPCALFPGSCAGEEKELTRYPIWRLRNSRKSLTSGKLSAYFSLTTLRVARIKGAGSPQVESQIRIRNLENHGYAISYLPK